MEKKTLEAKGTVCSMKPDYANAIISIVRSNAAPKAMCGQLEDYHENDIAEILPELTASERRKLYRILDVPMLSNILKYTEEKEAGCF